MKRSLKGQQSGIEKNAPQVALCQYEQLPSEILGSVQSEPRVNTRIVRRRKKKFSLSKHSEIQKNGQSVESFLSARSNYFYGVKFTKNSKVFRCVLAYSNIAKCTYTLLHF